MSQTYETEPVEGAIYDSGVDEPFNLWRWTEQHHWQKNMGWSPYDAPKVLIRLAHGPILRRAEQQPGRVGAVVRDGEGVLWVHVGDGVWKCQTGTAAWSAIECPVVEDYGRVTK